MAKHEQAIQVTAKLYMMRDTAKFLWGDDYPNKMAEWRDAIEQVARARKVSELRAAMLLSEEAQKQGADTVTLTIMAAYVEMTEPSAEVANG
jgi:plasmid replication initiation protein